MAALIIIGILAVIVAVRVYVKRNEILAVWRNFNAERKAQLEAYKKERDRKRTERYIKAFNRFSSMTADELSDPKKMQKAIAEAFKDEDSK